MKDLILESGIVVFKIDETERSYIRMKLELPGIAPFFLFIIITNYYIKKKLTRNNIKEILSGPGKESQVITGDKDVQFGRNFWITQTIPPGWIDNDTILPVLRHNSGIEYIDKLVKYITLKNL